MYNPLFFDDRERIVILDFDDTIFPTSQWKKNNSSLKKSQLQAIDAILCDDIIPLLTSLGCHCYIVSNARLQWLSSIIPAALPKLASLQIPVISARDTFSHLRDADWKLACFQRLCQTFTGSDCQFISIGDSIIEEKSALLACENCNYFYQSLGVQRTILPKIVKFRSDPSTDRIIRQLLVLASQAQVIVRAPGSMQILM